MFAARIAGGSEIHMHELLYPILQGYDSCELNSDLTIVGTDQLFNELMGRFFAERLGGYLRHYTMVPLAEIARLEALLAAGGLNPMEAKRLLGRSLVERYHSAEGAAREQDWFSQVFSGRSVPTDVPSVRVADPNSTLLGVLRHCLPAASGTELRLLIADGSVRLDGQRKLTDPDQRHPVSSGEVIRVGKRRWFRIVFGG